MNAESPVTLHGRLTLVLRGPDGIEKDRRVIENTFTTAGKAAIADQLLASPTLVKPTHMAIGTGSPAATLLGAEVGRVALTSKLRSGAVVTMVGDFAAGVGTGSITEAGIFNVVTANTVDAYSFSGPFTAIPKLAGDTLAFTWEWTVG